ncbi:MAG: SDR family oxidoreductase [Acidobacteriia bacterium]|nr:SDR family oxidoreductase [Terriglobia bacterium]
MAAFCVTGGAGFIGSNLVEALVLRGGRVRVVDNLSTGHLENLESLSARIEFINADIGDTARMREVFSGVDVVFHEAAIPSVQKSILDPLRSNQANITGTLSVLVAARDARVRRVIYAGSSSVYGDTPTLPKTESMAPHPISPYGIMKWVGELYAQQFTRLYGLETMTLRYFNVFGPRQDPTSEYSGVLAKFITAMLRDEQPVIYGDGEQSRDFTFVQNVVHANLLAAETSKGIGEVMNVAVGCRYSLNETLKILNRIFSNQAAARYEAERSGDIKHSQADISKARACLGYEPKFDFETGLRHTVEWYRSKTPAPSVKP